MKKQNPSKLDRIWLDPQKGSTTPVLPRWEGNINPPPQHMDLVLCTLHMFNKSKLKQWMSTNKHLSFKETLCGFFHYNPEVHGICLVESENDKVFLIARNEYGYAKAWSRSTSTSSRYSEESAEENLRVWDSLVIEFDQDYLNSAVYRQYPMITPKTKMLTLRDGNFLLARSSRVIDEVELENHMMEWIDGEKLNTSQNRMEQQAVVDVR